MTAANHIFLSWLRRGLGAYISSAPAGTGRPSLQLTVEVERTAEGVDPERRTATVTLPMFGPEDVTGLDARVILRTWPRSDVLDAEQKGIPLVEFSEPDLPWRYTPEAPVGDRLRPWISLIVLEEQEFTLFPSGEGRPFTEVQLTPTAPLPVAEDAWAWAHVDLANDREPDGDDLARFLRDRPNAAVSRLLAARRLLARKRYTAMIVPTASLPVRGATPATGRRLRVYHHWSFSTGPEGDFESLARRIRSTARLATEVGRRTISLRHTAPVLHAEARGARQSELTLHGALVPLSAAPAAPTELVPNSPPLRSFAELLNDGITSGHQVARGVSGARPRVAPPAYGSFFFPSRVFPEHLGTSVFWYEELNLNLHRRIAAGVGTEIIQSQQESLMASAWAQVEGIRAIQEALNFARVSRAASQRLYERDIRRMPPESLLLLTEPVHAQVMSGDVSVARVLARSRIPPGVLQPAWRRFARPRGALGRRQRRAGRAVQPLLKRLNDGTLRAAEPPTRPPVMTALDLAGVDGLERKALERALVGASLPAQILLAVAPELGDSVQTPERIASRIMAQQRVDASVGNALVDLVRAIGHVPAPNPVPASVDLTSLAEVLRASLDPALTIGGAMRARLRLHSSRARQESDDPLAPILTCPEFPQPMSVPLRELSQEWILPGLDKVPKNRAALLKTNRAFVEAYLVGLNHEMARELLWRGYPTDQRGTCFRRFWNHVSATTSPSAMDIPEIHRWSGTALGTHGEQSGENLVFLVRADLFERYPTTVLAAVRNVETNEEVLFPSFVGTMQPDVRYAGFPRRPQDLRGGNWFFAILEQVTETRFEDPSTQLAQEVGQSTYLAWNGFTPPPEASNAAGVAKRLMHHPVRVLVPADQYLEERDEEPS